MPKQFRRLILFFICMIFILTACYYPSEAERIEAFYCEYTELANTDPEKAASEYLYFNDPNTQEMWIESAEFDLLYFHGIESIVQLSDDLWVLQVWTSSTYFPEKCLIPQFVGVIEGEYRIMISVKQLPDYYKEQIVIDEYTVTVPNSNK